MPELVLRSELLEPAGITFAPEQKMMNMTAPNLRGIIMNMFSRVNSGRDDVVRIVAPKLEEIAGDFDDWRRHLRIHELTSVRRLGLLWLDMHGKYRRDGDVGFWLLENCPSVEYLHVVLGHRSTYYTNTVKLVDQSESKAPPLANVRSMILCCLRITSWQTYPRCS